MTAEISNTCMKCEHSHTLHGIRWSYCTARSLSHLSFHCARTFFCLLHTPTSVNTHRLPCLRFCQQRMWTLASLTNPSKNSLLIYTGTHTHSCWANVMQRELKQCFGKATVLAIWVQVTFKEKERWRPTEQNTRPRIKMKNLCLKSPSNQKHYTYFQGEKVSWEVTTFPGLVAIKCLFRFLSE